MSIQPVSGQTRIVGIFGDPIAHTRSPAMQNAAFRARHLPYIYVPFLVRPGDLRQVVLIGAGGATRALLVSLIRAGSARITIVNRTLAKAQALARSYRTLGKTQLEALPLETLQDRALLQDAAIVVNCTSVGLHGEAFPPLAYSATPRQCLFYDLLYRPTPTSFLRQARLARRPVLDGRRMLLHQGALAFSLWTRMPAPLDAMTRALNRALRAQ
jgi:shikimate dehydrogenase